MNEALIKKLMSAMKCSACGESYQINNIKIVGHQDDTWFLNISCISCQRQSFVIAIMKGDKPPEIITDLTEKEAAKISQSRTINADDMLDIHNFLKDFDGDFSRLFNSR